MTIKPPAPPYVGPAAHTSTGSNQPIHRIVIHCTVSPCVPGGARATAAYFRTQASGGSAHYVVDPSEAVQVVYDDTIAWHAPPNANSIGVELTDSLVSQSWDKTNANRWQNPAHQAMLNRAADLVAQLALAYGVPIRRLSSADLLAGKHGICGHVDVSQAWHQSDHWDPGASFPWDQFMALVKASAAKFQAPPPAPAAATKRAPRRSVFHVHKGQPYHLEDSLRGIRLAVARLFKWIDLDCHVTADGVLIITHWDNPRHEKFADPAGKVDVRGKKFEDLTWAEVRVLRSPDGYRIQRADVAVPYALSKGLKVELEAKTTAINAAELVYLRNHLSDRRKVQVKAFPKFLPALEAAHKAGFVTIALTHAGQESVPASAKSWLTYFRGRKPRWT